MGKGVTVNISEPDDIRAAYRRAAQGGLRVLIEQFIDGSAEYRAHASSTTCHGVFQRLLPSITGDGTSTVTELIEQKNQARQTNPSTSRAPLIIDDVAEEFLTRQGLSWSSVVPSGEDVIVRDVNGITSGGDSYECLDEVSESLKETAIGAVAAIPGMDWGGVDILVEDTTGVSYVMEVNTDAAINGSTFPVFGTPRDLGAQLWTKMYDRSKPEFATPITTPYRYELSIPVTTREKSKSRLRHS